ncbi:MAG: transglycosylase SLT domain-containing protein [Anaerolineae bacterium]
MQRTRPWLVFFALATILVLPLDLWLLDGEVLGQVQAGLMAREPFLPARLKLPVVSLTAQPDAHSEQAAAPISVFAQGLDEHTLQIVQKWARYYQVDVGFALCVARHESHFDNLAVGDGGAAFGLYQFWLPTWKMMRQKMGLSTEDRRFHLEESIKTACWAFAHGYRSYWAAVKKGLCP